MILDAILAKDLPDGSLLPSEQELCRQLGAGRNTVRSALRELEQDGIIIKQNGRPSTINLKALRKKRKPLRRIAWFDNTPIGLGSTIYFEIFKAMYQTALLKNIQVDYISLSIEAMMESFLKRLSEYNGFIVAEQNLSILDKYCGKITLGNCISIDEPRNIAPHCVCTDNYRGGQMAAEHLLECGHRHPVFLGVSASFNRYTPFKERLRGFQDTMRGAGIEIPESHLLIAESEEYQRCISPFLKQNLAVLEKADSIFAISDMIAIDTLYSLPKLGLRIPEDISLIGYDGMPQSQFVIPALTTIRQPVEDIGRKALEMVLNPTESASCSSLIPILPTLVEGDSVADRGKITHSHKKS